MEFRPDELWRGTQDLPRVCAPKASIRTTQQALCDDRVSRASGKQSFSPQNPRRLKTVHPDAPVAVLTTSMRLPPPAPSSQQAADNHGAAAASSSEPRPFHFHKPVEPEAPTSQPHVETPEQTPTTIHVMKAMMDNCSAERESRHKESRNAAFREMLAQSRTAEAMAFTRRVPTSAAPAAPSTATATAAEPSTGDPAFPPPSDQAEPVHSILRQLSFGRRRTRAAPSAAQAPAAEPPGTASILRQLSFGRRRRAQAQAPAAAEPLPPSPPARRALSFRMRRKEPASDPAATTQGPVASPPPRRALSFRTRRKAPPSANEAPSAGQRAGQARTQLRLRMEDDAEADWSHASFRVKDASERKSRSAVRLIGEAYAEMG